MEHSSLLPLTGQKLWQLITSVHQHGKQGIEDFSWGQGVHLCPKMGRFLNNLSDLVDEHQRCIDAHAQIKNLNNRTRWALTGRYRIKENSVKTGSYCSAGQNGRNMVLFANYKTLVMTTDNGKKKAQGGERVMYTNHRRLGMQRIVMGCQMNYHSITLVLLLIFASQQVKPYSTTTSSSRSSSTSANHSKLLSRVQGMSEVAGRPQK